MHTIRLRGPWIIESFDSPTSQTEANIPGDWSAALGSDYRGRARFIRRFGLPTNLDATERVFLSVGEVIEQATIELNGSLLGEQVQTGGAQRYEVTNLLQPRNELVVTITARDACGGIHGEVKLEIVNSAST